MKWLLILCTFASCLLGSAQVIENPVFDRTDQFTFRVKKVEITADTTYVCCSYQAKEHSWANISEDTFLEDISSGIRLPLLKTHGLPFSPEKRHFTDADTILVILYFPHIEANKFNIIENEDEESFNIYGIDINRSYTNSYSSEDISTFFDLAQKEEKMENWQSAVKYSLKQLEATDYVEGIQSFPSVCAMYNLTMQLIQKEEYDRAIKWGNKAIDIINTLPKDSAVLDVLARTYGNVSTAYIMSKQNDKASYYMELSLAARRFGDGIGTLNYEEYLRHLSVHYYNEGNYPRALLYGKEVTSIFESKFLQNNHKYGCVFLQSLYNLCSYYDIMDQQEEAITTGEKALQLINSGVCDDISKQKFIVYNNLASALANKGHIDKAIMYLEMILEAANNQQLIDTSIITSSQLLLADICLDCKKDTIRAEKLFKSVLEVRDQDRVALWGLYNIYREKNHDLSMKYLKNIIDNEKNQRGDKSLYYALFQLEYVKSNIADALVEKYDTDSMLIALRQSSEIIKRHIINTSYNLSKNERANYWRQYERLFTWIIPTICGMIDTPESNSLAYDTSLFYKGLLLSSEINFKKEVFESNDSSLIQLYNLYVNNLSLLEELYTYNTSTTCIDSLKTIIKNEEYILCQKVTRFNKQIEDTHYKWEDVRDRLKEQEVAIEIISYRNIANDDTYYDAYIIAHDSEAPLRILLCSENDLKGCFSADTIDYNKLSIIIWGNEALPEILKNHKRIYISTSGLLNTIGIEYLPIAGNRNISDRFELYRLSSTRELCNYQFLTKVEKVCLYGGLNYDERDNIYNIQNIHKQPVWISQSLERSIKDRGGFEFLPGSIEEIQGIKLELQKKKINYVLYSDTEGTEESFKDLSREKINILHLSTHGMYVPSEKSNVSYKDNYSSIISDKKGIDVEDKALSRSFLVMSGGNTLISRDSISQNIDDGILTALEISHLDFKDLDLVVLSACQTALGETNSEGVFGLQRGFKKAGANTILMSLDKVDDEATRILMVEFYKNLMSGQSKLQSLKNAQKYLRNVEDGKYDDPKYWASFIMLDGLN